MRADLDLLFSPRSVAIVGASSKPDRLTGRPLHILRRHGFAGDINVVHPRAAEIDGVRAYPSVADLPAAPDVLLVMVRADLVPGVARAAGEKGVKHLVILSSGFEETDEGAGLSAQLRDIAASYGMGVVGPNSEGFWHLPGKAILTFGSAAMRDDLVSGPVAVLSQSGSIGASIMRNLNDVGVGADIFVSVGNETVLGVADYLSWIAARGSVRVVACFLEGLRDGRTFLEAASAARAAGIAVVVLKAGASEQGKAASASHTGKISTSAAIYDALFDQAGVIQVESVEQLAQAAATLSRGRLRDGGKGAGLTVIGLSGGSRSIIADAAGDRGIPLAELAEETTASLSEFIPHFGVATNPVDPTGQVISDPALFPRTIRTLAADPSTLALLVQYGNGGTHLLRRHLPALGEAVREQRVQVVVSCLLDQLAADDPLRRELAAAGVGYVHDPVAAVSMVAPLFRSAATGVLDVLEPVGDERTPGVVGSWDDVVAMLAGAGIRAPREVVVEAGADPGRIGAALAAAGLEAPLVVKPSPDDVQHKSDLGLVFLRLDGAEPVAAAVAEIAAVLGPGTRAVVQEMVASDTEVLVVLRQDPDFGPVLGLGLGGFFIELIGEMTYVSLPASEAQLRRAIQRTKLGQLLRGYRGRPPVDLDPLVARLAALGNRFATMATPPRLVELNPVLVLDSGELVAIDSLVEGGPR
ncbi:acetate--CoA ligase family protein [Dactylosporangium sucinum]|uniref:Pimeloyl-CoA synthetase n=1 Tax=Dactylosporangium sucinum TaxID=1424081 RepID=A0A917X6A4_9ACTN|nr:acetate--CoA ligase family protein [Dactylosporangium sucinum]GGM76150.1 pimeloyl-CoA synthetase [Dactylosporangium sucinum]